MSARPSTHTTGAESQRPGREPQVLFLGAYDLGDLTEAEVNYLRWEPVTKRRPGL